MLFRHIPCEQALGCFTSLFRPWLQGRSQALDALCNDWEYPLRNAWEYQQYRKASGYSSIKAALRCSSATCFAHKPLNASLHSFVHGLQGRSQAFEVLCNDWEYPLRKAWKYKLCNAWEYQQYRWQVATVASRLRFDALPPHALRTSTWMLHFAFWSEDCKDEVKLLMAVQWLEISDI